MSETLFHLNGALTRGLIACVVLQLAVLCTTPADAQVHKCVDAEGNPTYSQIPCQGQETSRVATDASPSSDIDCRWATRFARDVARGMRTGRSAGDTFDEYGGVDAVNPGTLNLINYVYRYESASGVSIERIASLTTSMCSAGQLGDVSCDALPFDDDDPDRCEANEPNDDEARQAVADGVPAEAVVTAGDRAAAQPARVETGEFENNEDVTECKKPIRDEIDAIYAAMREGYDSNQGERYRARLRELSKLYRGCE